MTCDRQSPRVAAWRLGALPVAAALLVSLGGCAAEKPVELLDLVTSFDRAAIRQGGGGGEMPRASVGDALLFLPAGSALTYSFEAGPGSALVSGRIATRGEGVELKLALSGDGAGANEVEGVPRAGREITATLPVKEFGAVSLTLEATASEGWIDGDGVLLTAPTIRGPRDEVAAGPEIAFERTPQPNVILYLIDTLRRDRLGAYGYERPVSPEIDRFAEAATVFENGIGQSSWTKASVASMLSGVWPPAHETTDWSHRLPQRIDTLTEQLKAAGYDTAAFLTNVNTSASFGFDQGFDHFWHRKKLRSDLVNESLIPWIEARESERPLFLYVHTMDPHAGYNPEEPYRSLLAPTADEMKPWRPRWKWPVENLPFLSDLYDGEIAQNDAAFGAFVEALRRRGLFDSSLIVVLSDHGEEFRENKGWRHGRVLHHGSLHVPIIVKFPRQSTGARSSLPASHVDVLPTILDLAGMEQPPGLDGQSLAAAVDRPVFSHLQLGRAGEPSNKGPLQYSVVSGRWKLIKVYGENARTELFDMDADPGELDNLAARLPARTALLEGLLRQQLARSGPGGAENIELTDDLQDSLRALGYLQ